jgi:hypothetical protein
MHDESNSIYPSFFLAEVQIVHTDTHAVDIQPYGLVEPLSSVPIMTDPSIQSLPRKGDIVICIFDNRMRPMAIGFYTKYIRDGSASDVGKYYQMNPGDIVINSSSAVGGRLMMLQSRGLMRFASASGQGIEIDPTSGTFVTTSHSKKDVINGVVERSGWIRRKQLVTLFDASSVLDLDNLELVLQKIGGISTAGSIVHDTLGMTPLNDMYEKRIEIKVPGSQTDVNFRGVNLYEETIGTGVISNDPAGLTYTETLSSQSSLPLRKKTVYYDPTGSTPLLTEEIDCQGNVHLFISSTASSGIQVDALVNTILNFMNLTVTTTGNINLNGTLINLNGGGDNVVLATLLSTFFNLHTHTSSAPSVPTSPPIIPMTSVVVSSATVKAT